ncbi:MAG: glucose-phosphate thymidylyltransferase, partial [Sediminibacterium sp.]|nr:glucose-phosphate thymidylyltransferase [Sediminibacterium sp.]
MAIILFDNTSREGLYPLSLTKAVADLRFGILSIRERWERRTGQPVFIHTAPYLQPLYDLPPAGEHLWIDASLMAGDGLLQAILALEAGTALEDEKGLIAAKTETDPQDFDIEN